MKVSVLKYFKFLLGFIVLLSGFHTGVVQAANSSIHANQLVVMIKARFPTTGELTVGAGIVVGRQGGAVYIVTAKHVLEALLEEAENIEVQFADNRGFGIEATIIPNDFDKNLDLMIIAVPAEQVPSEITGLDEYAAANLANSPQIGEGAFFIGQPNGLLWGANSTAQPIANVRTTLIEVSTDAVVPGYSGGAVLDKQGRIIGLTYETQNGRALVIPIAYLKENVERSGYPFLIVNVGVKKEFKVSKAQQKSAIYLRTRGYELDMDSYFSSIMAADGEAIGIFHNLDMGIKSEQTLQWIKENRNRFGLSEIRNFAHYAQIYPVKSNQGLLNKLLDEYALVDNYLKSAQANSIDVAELCKIYQNSDPIFGYSDQNNYCSSLPKQHLILQYMYNVFSSYIPQQQIDKSNYILENYIPTWFVEGNIPQSMKYIKFKQTRDENKIPAAGYSIAETNFTVWGGGYAILPDFGRAIRLNNSKASLQNRTDDGDICYSFSYSGKRIQHVQCYGTMLLYRRAADQKATVIAVKGHLNSHAENRKYIQQLKSHDYLSDQTWRSNETQAIIFPQGDSQTEILSIRCVGTIAYVTTDIGDIVGKLPNKFDMQFKFPDGEYVLQFGGQIPKAGKTYRPYVSFAPRELMWRLAGDYPHVDLSIEGVNIGRLPLIDAKWALEGALQGKGCY